MKKTFLLSSFCFLIFSFSGASAYTYTDVQNATFLADQNIIVKQSVEAKYRLDDTITRAEVVGMALKIKWTTLPDSYSCKNYFTDVKYDAKNNWVCRAVELAADNWLVSRSNVKFRPQDKITRAEALAIIMKSVGIENNTDQTLFQRIVDANGWQKTLIYIAYTQSIIFPEEWKEINCDSEGVCIDIIWHPNNFARRGDVFDIAKNIVTQKKLTGCLDCNESYNGFSANFAWRYEKFVGDTPEEDSYSFGRRDVFEYSMGYQYSLSVYPHITFEQSLVDNPDYASFEKKSWDGVPYYAGLESWMCETGKLLFFSEERMIAITGTCGEIVEELEDALKKINFKLTA